MSLSMKERKPIYRESAKMYQKAGKKGKSIILDNFIIITGLNRSYASNLLRTHGKKIYTKNLKIIKGDIMKKSGGRGRKSIYGEDVKAKLFFIWKGEDFICGKRLKAALDEVIENLIRHEVIDIPEETRAKLRRISAATIDRLLKPERKKMELKGRSGTKPGTLLKHLIPVRTFEDWNENRPGFFEIDLVGHDGGNSSGDYAQTLDMVDIHTGWTETYALFNKAAKWVIEAIETLRDGIPFDILGLDNDCGAEFINYPMLKYCGENKFTFTRGRSGKKNDNCYVEQKNYSIVRKTVGYARYDTPLEVKILNELYVYLRLYTNHFQPVMKLMEKIRIGSKVRKKYDEPKTPYQRVLESPFVSDEKKKKLIKIHNGLNLYELKKQITRCQVWLKKIQTEKKKHPFSSRFFYDATNINFE